MNSEITSPSVKIKVNDREISADIMDAVKSLRFEEEINMASMFVLTLSTSDSINGTWRFLDLDIFSLGSEVKLYMGMEKLKLMMIGEITSLEPSFGEGLSTINVRGYDRLHRLRFGKKRRTFSDMKDSDIASDIASEWELRSQVEDTKIQLPVLYQNNLSDLEFLLERARRIRYEVQVNDKTLYFKPAKENDPVSLSLEYKVDIDELSLKLSARYEGSEINVQGWDFMKKDTISAKAKKGNEVTKMSAQELGTNMTEKAFGKSSSAVVDEYLVDTSDAEMVAIARYNAHLVESVIGEGRSAGMPELRAGRTVDITGVGRFSGIYYVTSTSHTFDSLAYNTSFKVRRVGI